MTVRPSKPSIRKAQKPGARAQAQTPRPEQPIDASGNVAEPQVTYEELLQYRRDADLKLREWRTAFERVYEILDENDLAPKFAGYQSQIARAKEEIMQVDRHLPKMKRISMAPKKGDAKPATRLGRRR